jgi:hypothetical protein
MKTREKEGRTKIRGNMSLKNQEKKERQTKQTRRKKKWKVG